MSKATDPKLIERIQTLSHPLTPTPTGLQADVTPLPYIRAVLFDIYGTLLISEQPRGGAEMTRIDGETFRTALAAAGWDGARVADDFDAGAQLDRRIQSASSTKRKAGIEHPDVEVRGIWRDLIAEALGTSAKKLDEAAVEQFAVELECRLNRIWGMPGLSETLETLRAAGLKLGLVADAQFYTPLSLEAMLGKPLEAAGFDPICCVYSYLVESTKPSARLYEETMIALENEYAILSDEVLYVGSDMCDDILPAGGQGFKTALFAGDARSLRLADEDPTRGAPPPDRILTRLDQLGGLLGPVKKASKGARLDLEADIDGDGDD